MKHNNISQAFLFLLFLPLLFACQDAEEPVPVGKYGNGVLISNEGNFTEADGSIGFYDYETQKFSHKIFETENGRPFGGLLQSIGLHDGYAYLIDNLGNKVEIVDANNFESVSAILEGLSIPRYFTAEGNTGFFSNWGPFDENFASPESYVAVLDTESNQLELEINVPSRPEGLIVTNGKLYVSSQASNTITVIDIETLQIIDSIEAGFGSSHFVIDKNGKLWVTCLDGKLRQIDPASNTVMLEIPVGDLSGKFDIDGSGENIYLLTSSWAPDFSFTENEVIRLNIASPQNQVSIFSAKNLYGIGIDPKGNSIYLANSNAFQGNGTIIILDESGVETDNFEAGRGPNGFIFRN